jgi:phosphate transport system permease protein
MVTGNAARVPKSPVDLLMSVRTMTATIAAEMGEVAQGSIHYQLLFAIGVLLFLISFSVNLAAAAVVFRQVKRSERLLA